MEVASALSTLQPLPALTPQILLQGSFGGFEREAEAVDSDERSTEPTPGTLGCSPSSVSYRMALGKPSDLFDPWDLLKR